MRQILWLIFLLTAVRAAEPTHSDVEFAAVGKHSLKLDLYLPNTEKPGLIVWVHGGAWRVSVTGLALWPDFPPRFTTSKRQFVFCGRIRTVLAKMPRNLPSPALLPVDIWSRWQE